MMKTVYIASDHRGYNLKAHLKKFLEGKGVDVVDCGNEKYDPSDDYPDFAHDLAKRVSTAQGSLGIAICGSGIGVNIVANRYSGIRAAVAHNTAEVLKACEHDLINVLSLSADDESVEKAESMVESFLTAKRSEEERHVRRINKMDLS